MSKISLRDYNHEIEGLINGGRTDEAIAHCKYILRLFPKCVDTYRLLGKAYLEAQRYSEATDILTRILSVVPDDFVSQIGMSIIREDEGNLDAAIYHMERAFEVKPSNSAIQEELRRLYGRRDGITPPRVRLTRGALVRMYTRGELYPQAIAEIRAALAEDPKRVDLEVILARIYMVLGRKAEAIEVCSRLVNKLPNCLEANRILSELLPGTSRAEDAEAYKQRVIALDPYSANLTSSTPTSSEVPDNSILIDFLEYSPTQQGSQPEWAQSVGVNLQESEEAIPDWLVEKPSVKAAALPEPPPAPVSQPEYTELSQPVEQAPEAPVEATEHDEIIPDWMKSAGWTEANPAPVEIKETPAPQEEAPEDIAQAELPDWLKAIAPAQVEETPSSESDQEDLARLDQLLNSQVQEPPTVEETTPVEQTEPSPVDAVAQPEQIEPAVELPAWLEEPPSDQASAAAPAAPQEEVPDWLADLSAPTETVSAPAEAAPAEELPDWLKSFASEPPAEESLEPVSEASPDWLNDIRSTSEPVQSEEVPASEIPLAGEEPMPEWLKGLGEEIAASSEISAVSPAEPEAEIPNVPLETAFVTEPEPEPATPDMQAEMPAIQAEAALEPEPEFEAGVPEAQAEIPVEMPVASTEAVLPVEPQPDLAEAAVEEPAGKTQPVAVRKIEVPVEEVPVQEAAPAIAQEPAMEIAPAERPADDSIDAALAWLESLAVQQGADQDTLLVPADQRTETPPAWVQKEIDTANAALVETPAEAEVETPLESEIAPVSQPETEAFAPVSEQLPAEEIPQTAPVEEITQPVEPAAMMAAEVPVEEISVPETAAAAETAAPSATAPEDMDLDAAFAWLESLAARQGAEPETLSTPAGEQPEQPPAWIPLASAEEESQPAVEMPESPAEMTPAFEATIPELPEIEPVAEAELPETVTPAPEVPAAEFLAEEPAAEEALPDWLKGLETPPAEPAPSAAPGESVSLWLKNIQVPEEQEPGIVPEQPVEPTAEEPLPEWLQGIEAVTPIPAETIIPAAEPTDELPDWLKEAEPAVPEKAAESAEEGLPEWLQGLDITTEPVEVPVIPVEPVAEEIIPAAELFQEQPAEPISSAEELAAETMPVAELPQEQPPEFVPYAESPFEAVPVEQPVEIAPVEEVVSFEEPAPVAEELPSAVAELEQPEIPAAQVEEILKAVEAPNPEEIPAEEIPAAAVDRSLVLIEAQSKLEAGDLDQALPKYTELIESQAYMEEIIRDLQNALYRHPVNVALHETLGDAYARSDRLQDALDTYTKAEELLVK